MVVSVSHQPTENLRGLRSGHTNNASGKWSMALLLPSSCQSLVGVVIQQVSATRGSHPSSQRNGTNPTTSRWPGCDASFPSPRCVLRSNAYAGPALLMATHLDRPSPPQTYWRQSETCDFKYFDSHQMCTFLLPSHSSPLPPFYHSRTKVRTHSHTHQQGRTHTLTNARTEAHTHARTYIRTHARTHEHSHTRTHPRTYADIHACTHARTHRHARTHAHTHTHARTQTLLHSHTYEHTKSITHAHTYARTYAHTHTRTHAFTHTSTHAQTHTPT